MKLTRADIEALARAIRQAVAAGSSTVGQVSIADARKALLIGLYRVRQQEGVVATTTPKTRRRRPALVEPENSRF